MKHGNSFTAFKEWLPGNNVFGSSIKAYVSYLTSIEKTRGISVDELLNEGIDKAVKSINPELIPDRPEETLRSYKQALRKYWKFLQSQQHTKPPADISSGNPS